MPPGIIIIGLGPGGSEFWTQAAHRLLSESGEIYLRTARHPSVNDITAQTYSFDDWYEQSDDFDQAHDQVAAEVVRLGRREEGVIYAVPGHPNIGEATMPRIRTLAGSHNLPITIIPGLSFLGPIFTALELDLPNNLQMVDAGKLVSLHHPPLEPDRPALVTHLYHQNMVGQVKRTLLNAYGDDFTVTLIQAVSTEAEDIRSCPLSRLDSQSHPANHLSFLYLPADASQSSFSAFQETIAHLRAPDGCPWDREQTHQSLRPFLLEETFEVLETLDRADSAELAEELGDLLLQIVLHTQIAIDTGEFKMGAVIDHINRKLIRRHPHVFGNVTVNGVTEVATNWEAIKREEKNAKGQSAHVVSALDGIPAALPALAQALAVSKRAVRVGFEWPNIEGVLEKIVEEAREIVSATNTHELESEIGDLLFSVVNLARWREIDPESALRTTNARFGQRFRKMEALATAGGKSLTEMSIEEMEALWEEAKRGE